MKIFFLNIICFLAITETQSQTTLTEFVTKENDTIKNVKVKNNYVFENDFLMSLQEKVIIVNNDGSKKELLPNEIKSFILNHNDEDIQYESVDDKLFGQLMYSNKLKLLKVNTRACLVFIIKRPNNAKTLYMEAMGLSRLISLKVISREMKDCPETIKKVDEKTLKVHGLGGVIELAKDYETNCIKQ